jgi:hypothetical protein
MVEVREQVNKIPTQTMSGVFFNQQAWSTLEGVRLGSVNRGS